MNDVDKLEYGVSYVYWPGHPNYSRDDLFYVRPRKEKPLNKLLLATMLGVDHRFMPNLPEKGPYYIRVMWGDEETYAKLLTSEECKDVMEYFLEDRGYKYIQDTLKEYKTILHKVKALERKASKNSQVPPKE